MVAIVESCSYKRPREYDTRDVFQMKQVETSASMLSLGLYNMILGTQDSMLV